MDGEGADGGEGMRDRVPQQTARAVDEHVVRDGDVGDVRERVAEIQHEACEGGGRDVGERGDERVAVENVDREREQREQREDDKHGKMERLRRIGRRRGVGEPREQVLRTRLGEARWDGARVSSHQCGRGVAGDGQRGSGGKGGCGACLGK